jgi:hypothetical protein
VNSKSGFWGRVGGKVKGYTNWSSKFRFEKCKSTILGRGAFSEVSNENILKKCTCMVLLSV